MKRIKNTIIITVCKFIISDAQEVVKKDTHNRNSALKVSMDSKVNELIGKFRREMLIRFTRGRSHLKLTAPKVEVPEQELTTS